MLEELSIRWVESNYSKVKGDPLPSPEQATTLGMRKRSGQPVAMKIRRRPVQCRFRAPKTMSLRGQTVAISVSSGKGRPQQSNTDGRHLQGGVAMTVEVQKPAKLTGQVTSTAGVAAESTG